MKKLGFFKRLGFYSTGNLLTALTIIMAFPVSGGFLCLSVPDVLAIDFVLSGGEDSSTTICVDDIINVYVNGNPEFIDYGLAGCKAPIPIQAEDGDLIALEAIDSYGSCRALNPVYIHRSGCDAYDLITEGRNDGCAGYPASSVPFFTASYTVDLAKLSCPEVSVTKMRCNASVPTMVLWDENNETILPDSQDFPPEIISNKTRDPELVTFTAVSPPANDTTYTVSGYGVYTPAGGTETKTKLIYGPKDITFPADSEEIEVLFESSEIKSFTTVMKVDKVQWHVLKEGETEPKQQNVSKVLYFVTQPPIYPIEDQLFPPSGARVEVMDMACRLAKGLQAGGRIRAALEKGVCEENWGRQYVEARHFDETMGVFQLTAFLKDNLTDDADLSIMHYLCCKALGVELRLARLKRFPGVRGYYGYPSESALWLIVNGACSYLGQTFGPGLSIWEKGWHQVTEYLLPGGILSQLYDPTIKYNFIPALRGRPITYQNPGGRGEVVFKALYKPRVTLEYSVIGLMPILREVI